VSPLYDAVMLCGPAGKEVAEKLAEPDVSAPVPSVVFPAVNVTVPVGEPEPELGATVAVRATGEFSVGVAEDTDSVVLVAIRG